MRISVFLPDNVDLTSIIHHIYAYTQYAILKFAQKIRPLQGFLEVQVSKTRVCPLAQVSASTIFFATAMGNVKLTSGAEFVSTSRTIMATKLAPGDRVLLAAPSDVYEFIVLLTKGGFSIRFSIAEVAGYKRSAVGVRGIKLSDGDEVSAAYLLENSRDFSVDYMGKKLSLNRLRLAKRGGKGTKSR